MFFARHGQFTAVQQQAIPPIVAGKDALVITATASGKTEFVHYSNLNAQMRRETEDQFAAAAVAVCVATSTLELGIDIGSVDDVGLPGATPDPLDLPPYQFRHSVLVQQIFTLLKQSPTGSVRLADVRRIAPAEITSAAIEQMVSHLTWADYLRTGRMGEWRPRWLVIDRSICSPFRSQRPRRQPQRERLFPLPGCRRLTRPVCQRLPLLPLHTKLALNLQRLPETG